MAPRRRDDRPPVEWVDAPPSPPGPVAGGGGGIDRKPGRTPIVLAVVGVLGLLAVAIASSLGRDPSPGPADARSTTVPPSGSPPPAGATPARALGGSTSTTLDPVVGAARADLRLEIALDQPEVEVGGRLSASFRVVNASERAYPLRSWCGQVVSAVLSEVFVPSPAAPLFEPEGDVVVDGFDPAERSLAEYLGPKVPSGLFNRFAFRGAPCDDRDLTTIVLAPGETVTATGHVDVRSGGVGSRPPALVKASVHVAPAGPTWPFPDDVSTTVPVTVVDPGGWRASWGPALSAASSSAIANRWAGEQRTRIRVGSSFRLGAWRFRFGWDDETSDAARDLLVTTAPGSGEVVEIRELLPMTDPSTDPDAVFVRAGDERVLYPGPAPSSTSEPPP